MFFSFLVKTNDKKTFLVIFYKQNFSLFLFLYFIKHMKKVQLRYSIHLDSDNR